MKKYNKYDLVTKDFNLTDLMVVSQNGKKGIGDNYGVYTLLNETLRPYGIELIGSWAGLEGLVLRHAYLDKNFPEENFPILVQMYGWENTEIYICLERNNECEYGFYFHTATLAIRLVEYRWGSIKKFRSFETFADFWVERKIFKKKYGKMIL